MNPNNSVWKFLDELSQKKGITEVAINADQKVFVEREGQFIQLNVNLKGDDVKEFASDVANLNNRPWGAANPILDGNLPDGSRINIVSGDFAGGAPAISIRKYLKTIFSFDKTPEVFGLSPRWVELLKAMVSSRCNIIVSGGTGVGENNFSQSFIG